MAVSRNTRAAATAFTARGDGPVRGAAETPDAAIVKTPGRDHARAAPRPPARRNRWLPPRAGGCYQWDPHSVSRSGPRR
ncbi:MAG: hypothetical protein JO118_12780 [Acetobacteraceae bacterium]|nr:hypothetical protein [Acetobacteraceae bacterium]